MHNTLKFFQNNNDVDVQEVSVADPRGRELNSPKFLKLLFHSFSIFFFSFRPFPLVRSGHSVSSFSTSFCLQHPSLSHQPPPYLLSLHLKIFSLISLFSSFPVTPFPSSFFLHTLGLSS